MKNFFRQAKYSTSAYELSQLIPDDGIEIAFAGRSNAGKSSAINCLTEQKGLCKTSKTPGRTQLINFFDLGENRHLVDLPGYGFAKVPKKLRDHWGQALSRYLLERESLRGLVIVVDIRRGLSELDQGLINLAGNKLKLHILLTKSDKLSRSAVRAAVLSTGKQLGQDGFSVSSLSTLNRDGLSDLRKVCAQWLEDE